jgi:hypothetical protein
MFIDNALFIGIFPVYGSQQFGRGGGSCTMVRIVQKEDYQAKRYLVSVY